MLLADMPAEFARVLEIPVEDVLFARSPDYPECLSGILLCDVDPSKMRGAVEAVIPNDGFTRVCINVIEKEQAFRFRDRPFESAWKESWDLCIATVRS